MNRLQAELQRLYLPPDAAPPAQPSGAPSLAGADGRVRALVLEVARPGSWEGLATAWRGVQAELELPAPAIAVSGTDGCQLWFSLAEPVPAPQAAAFLAALRSQYLADVAPERIRMHPAGDTSASTQASDAVLPPAQATPGHWSAFVAPDLAGLFSDEPWLDLPPGDDAQADLLSRLHTTPAADFLRAAERLGRAVASAAAPAPAVATGTGGAAAAPAGAADPGRFLLDVMNDPTIALQLRIEAAKALLPYFDTRRPL